MTGDNLQRDISEMDFLVAEYAGIEITAAWQRIRARLSPDRERIKKAMHDVMIYHTGDEASLREQLADAAINAMGEP